MLRQLVQPVQTSANDFEMTSSSAASATNRGDRRGLRLVTDPIGDTDQRTAGDPSRSGTPSAAPSILIPSVLAGDLDAFEALYRAHSGEVYALCLRMSGDVSSAQELVQDVFVRAWERLASFRSESAFGTWLHRLAVNVVLETFRSDRRRLARVTPEADLTQFPNAVTGSSPDERIDLDTAIAKLPSGARIGTCQ